MDGIGGPHFASRAAELRPTHGGGILAPMDDQEILTRIQALIDEEHELRETDAEEHGDRIAQLEVSLDQCWDLLRQRRARRHAHLDPDGVAVRDEGVVEGYQQ